jgi:hypothetical protein
VGRGARGGSGQVAWAGEVLAGAEARAGEVPAGAGTWAGEVLAGPACDDVPCP